MIWMNTKGWYKGRFDGLLFCFLKANSIFRKDFYELLTEKSYLDLVELC